MFEVCLSIAIAAHKMSFEYVPCFIYLFVITYVSKIIDSNVLSFLQILRFKFAKCCFQEACTTTLWFQWIWFETNRCMIYCLLLLFKPWARERERFLFYRFKKSKTLG